METIEVSGSTLRCVAHPQGGNHAGSETIWSIDINDIILVAEYTTDEGPYLDDYFIVFVDDEGGRAYVRSCSIYSEGLDNALELLETNLGMQVKPQLVRSTHWDSRVLWPPNLNGNDYFQFKVVAAAGFGQKLRNAAFGPQLKYSPAASILGYIQQVIQKRQIESEGRMS
jgi:hypothetical protein